VGFEQDLAVRRGFVRLVPFWTMVFGQISCLLRPRTGVRLPKRLPTILPLPSHGGRGEGSFRPICGRPESAVALNLRAGP